MKLVIADDEVLVRKGIRMSIEWAELGIDEVFEATDGEQAFNIICENPIDILITDIRMPKMDGVELLNRISVTSPNTVSIVLSCVNDIECVREVLQFNKALDYIPKLTMTTDELKSVVRRAMKFVKGPYEGKNKAEKLPLFFHSDMELDLRRIMEYGTEDEIISLLDNICNASGILGTRWKESGEWDEIVGVFASVEKRYEIYEKEYLLEQKQKFVQEAGNIEKFQAMLTNLALQVKGKIEEKKRRSYDTGIRAAIEYMEENYNSNLKLGDVAVVAGMSESYFSRYFKKMMGKGFSEYLNNIRIEKAKKLLKGKRVTIQEVAEKVGFTNSAYFTQIFKGITGMLPKAYQNQFFD